MKTKVCLVHETRKKKIKNMINANKNPRRSYCKEETKQSYDKKNVPKIGVE